MAHQCSWFYGLIALLCLATNGVRFFVQGHGRLVIPPSRSSAWRYGFPTEKDYNDAEAYCGGWTRQHTQNGGKCGVCGDAWDLPQPRAHENSGRYGQGVIVATYKMNSDVEIGVELTANHQGYFEFRLCPWNGAKGPETDECFDRHLLRRTDVSADDSEGHKYHPGPGNNVIFRSTYKLPEGLTCTQCVLQWRYIAGNNWGTCPNGTGKVGCGPQEQFRGCADVAITLDGVPDVTILSTTTIKPNRTRGTVTSRVSRPTTTTTITVPVPTTTVGSSTASTTTTESNEIIPPDANYGGSNPGPYAGIIIALATLLFAILCLCGVMFYFYYCHQTVKKFAGDQWKRMRRRIASTGSSSSMEKKPPLKLPASVFSHHQPQLLQVVPYDSSTPTKPPVPPRINRQDREQQVVNVRQLSLVISEPLDVVINGVPVAKDDHEPNVSTA